MQFKQWQIDWIRRRGVRNLKLSLKDGDILRVVTPWRLSWEKALRFLHENESWIEVQHRKWIELSQLSWRPRFRQGEIFYILGEQALFSIVSTSTKKIFFSRGGENFFLHLPKNIFTQDLTESHITQMDLMKKLRRYYRQQAEELLRERLKIWSEHMNLPYKKVSFRCQKTRWGSCSSEGGISLNWKIVMAPLRVIDSILIHELAHLQYMNHSVHFWRLVEQHAPDHKESTQWLRKNNHLFKWLE